MPPASRTVPVACDVLLRPLVRGEPVRARVVVATSAAAYAQLLPPRVHFSRQPGAPRDRDDPAAGVPRLIPVLTQSAVRVPGGLLPAAGAAGLVAGLRPGDEVVLGSGAVVAGGVRLVPARWWDSRVPRISMASAALRCLPRGDADLPPLPDAVRAAAGALSWALPERDGGELLDEVAAALVGLGPGLTPAGDDVLAGALVALCALGDGSRRYALAVAVRPLLPRTTMLSAAFLEHAAAGRAVPELTRYVAALARGRLVGGVVQDLLHVGASSGTALAWGARIGLQAVAGGPRRTSLEVA